MLELLFATFLFTIIAGTVFSLLLSSQMRYQSESSLTGAFQQANVAIDQITRDVHSAGYPPANAFTATQLTGNPQLAAVPFAWSSGYPNNPCTVGIGGTCTIPGDYDLILEADSGLGQGVQWIRYSLDGTTLKRAVVAKSGTNPVGSTGGDNLTIYLENVLNGNKSFPIFSYSPDYGVTASPYPVLNIRQVNICLIVQSSKPDPQTGQLRTITLTGQAERFNPNQ
jgi:Tfp pilus assembly protein PilW